MTRTVYGVSVILTALALFWPVIYSNFPILWKLPGDPLVQAVVGVVLFGGLSYATFEDDSLTAS